jgi:hypothetical protein
VAAENTAFVLAFFREPLDSEVFLAEADAFFSAGFWGAREAFLAGLAVFARAADALDCAAVFFRAFGLAGFFGAFFFAELAIIFGIALG